jgi:hypothetical protein
MAVNMDMILLIVYAAVAGIGIYCVTGLAAKPFQGDSRSSGKRRAKSRYP